MKEAISSVDPSMICLSFIYPEEAVKALLGTELLVQPDFIFIDINMPVLTGEKCLKLLRAEERFDKMVITMCSTSMPEHVAAMLKRAGANYVFEKPVRLAVYDQILRNILQPK